VATDISVLREVGGDAAEYCPLADVPAWAAAILGLAVEAAESPEWRRARSARGRARAAPFTWSSYAASLVELYQQVAGRPAAASASVA
jgi:glycosyltransferase involved in cell wall biosynthesis